MSQYLEQMLALHAIEALSSSLDPRPALRERLKLLQEEISELESQVRLLISKQLTAGESLQQFYDEKLSELNERLKNMKGTEIALKAQSTAEREETIIQQQTLDELAQLSLQQFWQQDSRYINQVLHRLMGKKRLLLLNGDIVGVAEVNKRQRRHT